MHGCWETGFPCSMCGVAGARRGDGHESAPWCPMEDTMEENTTNCSQCLRPSVASCRCHAPRALGMMALFQLAPSCFTPSSAGRPPQHLGTTTCPTTSLPLALQGGASTDRQRVASIKALWLYHAFWASSACWLRRRHWSGWQCSQAWFGNVRGVQRPNADHAAAAAAVRAHVLQKQAVLQDHGQVEDAAQGREPLAVGDQLGALGAVPAVQQAHLHRHALALQRLDRLHLLARAQPPVARTKPNTAASKPAYGQPCRPQIAMCRGMQIPARAGLRRHPGMAKALLGKPRSLVVAATQAH